MAEQHKKRSKTNWELEGEEKKEIHLKVTKQKINSQQSINAIFYSLKFQNNRWVLFLINTCTFPKGTIN